MSASVQPQAAARATVFPGYVDDGKPVESVRPRGANRAARLTIAATLVGGLLIGYWWGGIIVDRKSYNRMVDDAIQIKTEVDEMAKRLSTITDALNKNQQKAPSGAPDFEIIDQFKALGELKPPDQQKLFHTNYARFENIAIDELFTYYNDTVTLYEQIKRHIVMSEKEKDLLEAAAKQAKTQEVAYGFVVEPGKITQGKLVQLVQTVCKGGKPQCSNVADVEGFMVSYAAGGTPAKVLLTGNGPHVVPIDPTPMFTSLIEGTKPEALAGQDWRRRLNGIRLLALIKLPQIQKSLQTHLDEVAKKPKLFTF
jgi:hypothetical protein